MHITYLLLGSNVGERKSLIAATRAEINMQVGVIEAASHLYETAPWGKTDQPHFLNQAIRVKTSLGPFGLLQEVRKIEDAAGRQRTQRWGPRTLDIDIILYDDLVLHTAELTLPHPRMTERRFVLAPLSEIAGELLHPIEHRTINELLTSCPDQSEVSILAD